MRAITAVIAALAASVTADLNGSGQPGSPITSNHIDCKNSKMPTGTGYIYAAQVGFVSLEAEVSEVFHLV